MLHHQQELTMRQVEVAHLIQGLWSLLAFWRLCVDPCLMRSRHHCLFFPHNGLHIVTQGLLDALLLGEAHRLRSDKQFALLGKSDKECFLHI